jgi:hypothetical protein
MSRLTARFRVRTLGRSKALKSQALACPRALQTAFREPVAPGWAYRAHPPSASSAARSFAHHFGGAWFGLMLKLTFGAVRTNSSEVFRGTKSREGQSRAGAKAELELARAKPAQAETTGEQRAPRGVTADREGKALKATKNPMGGCGAKQSHKARAGLNR